MPELRRFDLWGMPYDGAATLGVPGSRYAPDRIRKALSWMTMRAQDGMVYSSDTQRSHPYEGGTLRDRGDAPIVAQDLQATLATCSAAVAGSVREGRVPIVLGGDDCLLFGAVRGFHEAHEGTVAIVHFDAHLDLLDESPQQGRYSQSSGMRRALELPRVSAAHSIQVGVRNFNFPSSRQFIEAQALAQVPAREVEEKGVEAACEVIRARVRGADHVFLAFDIDVIDPSAAPGAGAHEPGGLTSRQALDFLRLLGPLCAGMSLVEVNPLMDLHDMTSSLAANLVFHFVVFAQPSSAG